MESVAELKGWILSKLLHSRKTFLVFFIQSLRLNQGSVARNLLSMSLGVVQIVQVNLRSFSCSSLPSLPLWMEILGRQWTLGVFWVQCVGDSSRWCCHGTACRSATAKKLFILEIIISLPVCSWEGSPKRCQYPAGHALEHICDSKGNWRRSWASHPSHCLV